jgi:hypothetical protein
VLVLNDPPAGVWVAGYYTETGEFVEGHYNESGEWVDGQPAAEAGAADAAASYPVAGAYADGTANADAAGAYTYTAEGAYANGSGAADETDTYTNGTGAAGDHSPGAGDAAGAYTNGLPAQGVDADAVAAGKGQGLTRVHFSVQPEPILKQKHTLHTP